MTATTLVSEPPRPSVHDEADRRLYRLSVNQYHQMAEAGIVQPDDQVELLDGLLVKKMTIHPPHAAVLTRVQKRLMALAPAGWHVAPQRPITTATSEPEPDLALVRGDEFDYLARHPSTNDLALMVDISDTSLQRDRTIKQRIYAEAGIPVYWIVNIEGGRVCVFTKPSGPTDAATQPAYQYVQEHGRDAQLAVVVDGAEVGRVTVSDLLP